LKAESSERKNELLVDANSAQQVAICPAIVNGENVGSDPEKSYKAIPSAGSVTMIESGKPGTFDMPNGKSPSPFGGAVFVNSDERVPSGATSHVAMNPGMLGVLPVPAIPLEVARNFAPSAEKRTCETVPGGPNGGVVMLSPKEKSGLRGVIPFAESTV